MSDYSTWYTIVSIEENDLETIRTAANAIGATYERYSRTQYIVRATRKQLHVFILLLQKDYDTITADTGCYNHVYYIPL